MLYNKYFSEGFFPPPFFAMESERAECDCLSVCSLLYSYPNLTTYLLRVPSLLCV